MMFGGFHRSIESSQRLARATGLVLLFGGAWVGGTLKGIHRFAAAGDEPVSPAARAVIGDLRLLSEERDATAVDAAADVAWDLPNLDHPRVDYWVNRFTTDKRDEFSRFLTRSGRYIPMISQKLDERGMPQDLIYLAMIESGFNPQAYSHANASGLWQFIAETGQRYGLDINRAVDERNDPVKSTDAALDYLTYLYNRFGSWYLAAAGYNTGENRVGRIMRQVTGSERGNEESYYRIWDRLPRETRDYVPLMVAAARITKEAEKYGFADVEIEPPMEYDEIMVEAAAPLKAVADAAGTTVTEIRRLNPHFKLDRTRNDMTSPVRVPRGGGEQFAANWEQVRKGNAYAQAYAQVNAPATRNYTIRRGDNLTLIARRHGVTVNQIRQANGLRGDRIRAGAVLRIPTG